jgi:hypothetical protein
MGPKRIKVNNDDAFGMDQMLETTAAKTASHLYSSNTRIRYDGHVSRGKEYLQNFSNGELKEAFNVLSGQTPTALLAFVAFKCEHSGYSYKTAEGIRSAFKQYFRDTFQCQGEEWRLDFSGQWVGNPVFEQNFTNYLISLKKQYGRENQTRQSVAMSYQDLATIMEYLQKSDTIQELGKNFCVFFQAFAATGFCLWTRYMTFV